MTEFRWPVSGALGLARLCAGMVIFAVPKRAALLFVGDTGNMAASVARHICFYQPGFHRGLSSTVLW
jgi:hypothetical protein